MQCMSMCVCVCMCGWGWSRYTRMRQNVFVILGTKEFFLRCDWQTAMVMEQEWLAARGSDSTDQAHQPVTRKQTAAGLRWLLLSNQAALSCSESIKGNGLDSLRAPTPKQNLSTTSVHTTALVLHDISPDNHYHDIISEILISQKAEMWKWASNL